MLNGAIGVPIAPASRAPARPATMTSSPGAASRAVIESSARLRTGAQFEAQDAALADLEQAGVDGLPRFLQIHIDPEHRAGAFTIADLRSEAECAHFVGPTLRALIVREHAQRQNVRRIRSRHQINIRDAV